MSTFGFIEYDHASPEVRAVYDDIMATRKTDWINNFWKAIAHDPVTLKRTWESIKQIMGPGALDPLTKELVYIAVSVTNNCEYCIHSHTAGATAKGMTREMYHELMAVVALAIRRRWRLVVYVLVTHVPPGGRRPQPRDHVRRPRARQRGGAARNGLIWPA